MTVSAQRSRQAALLSTGLALLWGLLEQLPSIGLRGYSSYQVVWMRYGVHLAFLAIVLGPKYGSRLVKTGRPMLQIGRATLMLTMPVCAVLASERLGGDSTWALFWLAPLMIVMLGSLLHAEPTRHAGWAATLICLAGALVMSRGPLPHSRAGIVFALGMGLSYALYTALTRSLRDEPTAVNLVHTAFWVFIPLSVVMPRVWRPVTGTAAVTAVAVGLLGLAGLWLLDRMAAESPVGSTAPFLYLQPVSTIAFRDLLRGRPPDRWSLVAAVVVVGVLARYAGSLPAVQSELT